MGFLETLLVYLVIGAVVAATLRVAARAGAAARVEATADPSDLRSGVGTTAAWALFWPFYLPGVLGRAAGPRAEPAPKTNDAFGPPIPSRRQATRERLLATVSGLSGVAEHVIRPQASRIAEMLDSLDAADERVAEMNELLRTPELDKRRVDAAIEELAAADGDPDQASARSLIARRNNILRLEGVRDRTVRELMHAELKLEEINSQVVLMRFAEQPEAAVAEALREVEASVAGVSQVVLEVGEV